MFEMQSIKREIEIEGFHSIYYFEFGKDFSHTPERHDFWEMVYVDKGRINAIADGVGCVLEQGQAIYQEPMEIHAHISDKRVANNMMVISFTIKSEAMDFFKGKTFTFDKTSKTLLSLFLEEARNVLGEVPGDYNNKSNLHYKPNVFGGSQLLQCFFTELLIRLVRSGNLLGEEVLSNKKSRDIASNSISELMTEYMKSNVYSNLSLKELCGHFMIGKTQFCKIFQENIGQSPMEYYAELRINEAKKLLREKNDSVAQIADKLGYSSIHTFSRAFKKAVGFSPTDYLKSIL